MYQFQGVDRLGVESPRTSLLRSLVRTLARNARAPPDSAVSQFDHFARLRVLDGKHAATFGSYFFAPVLDLHRHQIMPPIRSAASRAADARAPRLDRPATGNPKSETQSRARRRHVVGEVERLHDVRAAPLGL